ncbi:50S ribosomal protein L3 [Desulfoluna limicola]|uniref:Large ribosomal subunit protein uL3 n=1 Tax=Desulfoluna limicola TaxID=2810562 RepID=A0ABM7PLT0_9BACT|nr:50S ribosomal protein L3 [Desulfoluna limicola]BCS98471.1 50S ribosomal protein L3 [Desulfoluna limicola]
MSRGLLGKKLGMTGVYSSDGRYIPVTVVQVGPCVVTQIKTEDTDGYNAVQIGFGEKKAKHTNKPLQGHFAKSGERFFADVREFEVADPAAYTLGQEITAEMFEVGELVDVTGTSKGRGFSGTIKRHGFSRGPETHGCRNHRAPGSIGCSAWPAKVFKGKKLPGQYGGVRKTVRNLTVVDIRPEENVVLIKGCIPGSKSGLVEIKKPKFGN